MGWGPGDAKLAMGGGGLEQRRTIVVSALFVTVLFGSWDWRASGRRLEDEVTVIFRLRLPCLASGSPPTSCT